MIVENISSPFTGGEVELIHSADNATFRKEEFKYVHLCYRCKDTGETFTTTELDEINTSQVYNQYRQKYGIPFADEIRDVRERYGLSASKMSLILGFGENQYRLYESGEMPSVTNGRVLGSIQSVEVFATFLEAAKKNLGSGDYDKTRKHLANLANKEEDNTLRNLIFGEKRRNTYNGYARQSIQKLRNVILFFIQRLGEVYVTQMNKLLFYADFLTYRETGMGLSGLAYKAIQYGPVPKRWDRVYSLLDDISQEFIDWGDGKTGTKLRGNAPCDFTVFSLKEKNILERVCVVFGNETSRSISKKSHEETAWIENRAENCCIDYKYAFDIKNI